MKPAGHDLLPRAGSGVLDPEHGLGELLTESPMNFPDCVGGCRTSSESARVDPGLHGDVRPRLELQIAFPRLGAVVREQCPLDVHGVGVMALDEIAVVAVHRADEMGQPAGRPLRQAAVKPR